MKNTILLFFSLILTLSVYGKSILNISADEVLFDQNKQTNYYRGGVILNDGSNTITANEIYFKKNDKGDEVVAVGTPATYYNKSENIHISAKKIHYNQYDNTLVFKQNIILIYQQSRLESDSLTYHLNSKKIIGKADNGKRVLSIITNH